MKVKLSKHFHILLVQYLLKSDRAGVSEALNFVALVLGRNCRGNVQWEEVRVFQSWGIPDTSVNQGCNRQHEAWTNKFWSFWRSESHILCMFRRKKKPQGSQEQPWFANAKPFSNGACYQLQHCDTRRSLIYNHQPSIILTWHFVAPPVQCTTYETEVWLPIDFQTQHLVPETTGRFDELRTVDGVSSGSSAERI